MGVDLRSDGRRRGGRRGKSWRPERGHRLTLRRPPPAEGDAADEIVDQARRQTVSRRELERSPRFEEISPDVGELDEQAVEEALADNPDEVLSLIADLTAATDPKLRELSRALAGRLYLELARSGPVRPRGVGRLVEQPYRTDGGDIDLDASLEPIIEARGAGTAIDTDRLRMRSWVTPETAICLIIDRSGSMSGAPLATAALAAAAISWRAPADYAVLSFARDVVAVKSLDRTRTTAEVVDAVLALRGHGTTDLAGALIAADQQLQRSRARRRIALVLSDCRSNEPGDAVAAAATIGEIAVIAPEGDHEDAEVFAAAVGARLATVGGPSEIIGAIERVLDQ